VAIPNCHKRASGKSEYLDDLVRAGEPAEQASASAEQTFARYFPEGTPEHNHLVYDVVADGKPVGYLWIAPHAPGQTSAWWVWDIAIDADQRERGSAAKPCFWPRIGCASMGGRRWA